MLPQTLVLHFQHEVLISTAYYWSCMFLKDIIFWTANIISGRRVVRSHQIKPGLPLISSEKNSGDAGMIVSSLAQNIFLNQNVYSSPELSKWESYKSNAVSERCFAKQLFWKIMSCKIAVVVMLKRYLWKNKIKLWLIRTVKHTYTTNCFSSFCKWCEPITITTRNFFVILISLSSTSTYLMLLYSKK